MARILLASDVATYQGFPEIVAAARPDAVVLAGDVLYDGGGQRYLVEGRVVGGITHHDGELLKNTR